MILVSKYKVTMKDIAQHTGYSINTVSQSLRGVYPSKETQEKVVAAANSLGYIGNSIASSMRLGETRTIAIIQSDISNPYFSRMIRQFVNYLSSENYTAIIYNTDNIFKSEKNAILSAIRHNVDGLLICPDDSYSEKTYQLLKSTKVPYVMYANDLPYDDVTSVRINEIKGGYLACRHLIKRGCQNIVMLTGNRSINAARLRLKGYEQALTEHGLPYCQENVITVPNLFATQSQDQEEWNTIFSCLSSSSEFDGIVAYSDQIALKTLQGLRDNGFDRIPIDQIPIVGFDNILETFPIPLPLASISYTEEQAMAVEASRLLIDKIREKKDFKPQKLILDVKLFEHN